MTAKQEKRKKNIALLIVSAVMVLAMVVLAGPQLGIASNKRNISDSSSVTSSYPDLAVNSDASTLAIAWREGQSVYLRVRSEGAWEDKTTIFSSEGDQGAEDVAVAVTEDGEVHVAYATLSSATPTETEVRYRKYGTISDEIAAQRSEREISWVDLAVAENGDVHLVWAQYQDGGDGEIHYRKKDSSWGTATRIASEGNNHAPVAAIGGNYLHVAWKEDQTQNGVIYRRRELGGSWGTDRKVFTAQDMPGIPSITTENDKVFIIWDDCSSSTGKCSLSYQHSENTGATWSEGTIGASYDFLDMTYLKNLRPSITVSGDGRPTAVWHAESPTGLSALYGTSGDSTGANWLTPVLLSEDASSHLGTATAGGSGDLLHIAYMQEESDGWDIYYEDFSPALTAQIDYVSPPNATLDETWVISPTSPFELDGSGSSNASGLPLTYNWQLLETPEGSVSATVAPQFTTNSVFTADVEGEYTIKLAVSNGLATAQDTQQLLAIGGSDLIPHAQIDVDTLVPPNEDITLDGSKSSSPDGFDLTYNWQIVPTEGVTLSNASSVNSTLIATKEGWYTVTLEVDNGIGTDQDTKRILVSKHDDVFPSAQIQADTIIAVDDPVSLDGSDSISGGLPMDYQWSVSPTGTATLAESTAVSPIFTATAEGWYTMTLEVDNGVATDQDTQQILATQNGEVSPQAQISSTNLIDLNTPITLDGRGSTSPGKLDLTYLWWLSSETDGAELADTTNLPTTTFTATAPGQYTVTLRVDNGMATDRDTQQILAFDADGIVPRAQISVATSTPLTTSTPITLYGGGSSSPGDLDLIYHWWLPSELEESASLSNTKNVSATLTAWSKGSYTVTLEVDNGLATDQDTQVIPVRGEVITPVYAQIDVASPVAVSETVTLDGSGSSGGGKSLDYQWSVSPEENVELSDQVVASPTFTATVQGWYTVTLTVSNTNGTDRDTQSILVLGTERPSAHITVDTPNPVPLGEPVILDGSGSSNSETYHWALSPDGEGATLSNTTNVSSTFTAEGAGWYTVTLEVDNGVATDSDTRQILAGSAEDLSPQAHISVEPSNPVRVDETVTLSSEESSQGAGSTLTYTWSLLSPDDSTASLSSSSDASPTFTADAEGWYTVTLAVDNGIATDSDTKQILASSGDDVSPQAQIEAVSRVPVGKAIMLDGSGSSSGGGFDLTYSWRVAPDSGEVTSPDALSTTFTAPAAGRYTITLEVDNGMLTDRDTHHIEAWQNYQVYLPLVMRQHGSGDE